VVRITCLFAVILISLSAGANSLKSAVRAPGTSYLAYKSIASIFSERPADLSAGKAVSDSSIPYDAKTIPTVTAWESVAAMTQRFEQFRDMRWLTTSDHPGFFRRSSWLYPDDGCFARAGLAIMNLVKMKAAAPNKIFVFGDLRVRTDNALSGYVDWWYHVAPIVQIAGEKYVLDPALSPRAPIKLEDWLALMTPDIHSVEIAICKSGSYSPDDTCDHVTDGVESQAADDQISFLGDEWSRMDDLHRNPSDVLGDNPPWLSPLAPSAGL
jgi:hypothetical protein